MKKPLLLGTALLTVLSSFSQVPGSDKAIPTLTYKAGTIAEKYALINKAEKHINVTNNNQAAVTTAQSKKAAALGVWNPIGQSMNIFGVLVSASKPLHYNEDLNAVSFILRKSPHYQPSPAPAPTAASGAIVGMVTTDWGGKWDSTLLWADDTRWGRYPQGGIYNPTGNTNLSNAYLVASGPVTGAVGGWTGNFFASKKLDVFSNSTSTVPLSQQYISSTGPTYDTVGKVDFARLDFSATDDGLVRSLGVIYGDPNGTTATAQGFRGARIVKGSFNAGHFVWTSDSISLAVSQANYDNASSTYDVFGGTTNMAWSESGQYGYVWFIGTRTGATKRNSGYQPIVWKTTDYGTSWTLMPGINFNDTVTFKPVLDHLVNVRTPAQDSVFAIPFFNFREDITGIVDKNNNLHLVSALWSSSKSHPDSVGYTFRFTNADGEIYSYGHVPGHRPYIYDFTSKPNGSWDVIMVDSMATESPATASTGDGYGSNPWNVYDGSKQSSDARIQLSRTPNGEYIVYTWAESDTLVTSSGFKWNNIPDVHARVRHADSSRVHATEYNLTNDPNNPDLNVAGRAWMHNTSPKSQLTATAANGFTITTPVKVSNSTPLAAENPNTHYFSAAVMSFSLAQPTNTTGIADHDLGSVNGSLLFPNPAKDKATLVIAVNNNSNVEISLLNTMGQVIRTTSAKAENGTNNINVDVDGLAAGIYMVNVKIGNAASTKKLVVQ